MPIEIPPRLTSWFDPGLHLLVLEYQLFKDQARIDSQCKSVFNNRFMAEQWLSHFRVAKLFSCLNVHHKHLCQKNALEHFPVIFHVFITSVLFNYKLKKL